MAKDMPLGVKIISVLILLRGLIGVIGGFLLLINVQGIVSSVFSGLSSYGLGLTMALPEILVGIFSILVATFLWKGKNWARYLVSVVAIIGVVGSVFGIIGNFSDVNVLIVAIVLLILCGSIAWYLMKKDIKEKFS